MKELEPLNPQEVCIVFDLGKTIFARPSLLSFVFDVISEFGISLLNPFKAYQVWNSVTSSKEEAKKLNRKKKNVLWDQVFATKYASSLLGCSREEFYNKACRVVQKSANPYPGMLELIQELHQRGFLLAVLSNSDPISSKAVRESAFFKSHFHTLCLSDETGLKKPQKEAFEDLLRKVNKSATNCIFFDNNKKNIDAANQLGFHAHLFESPQQIREVLEKHHLLSNTNELVKNPHLISAFA